MARERLPAPTVALSSDDEDDHSEIDNKTEDEEEEQSEDESQDSQDESKNDDEDEKNEDEQDDEEESPAETGEKTQTLKTTKEHPESDSDNDNNTKESNTPKTGTQIIIPNASAKDDRSTITNTESLSLNSDAKARREKIKKRKLKHYRKQENRRKKRMTIKARAYRMVNTDLNVSESEAESEDEELEDSELGTFRTQTLTRLYIKKGRRKASDLIKSNTIHQAMIGKTLFDGSVRGLNTFIIDLKSTSVSRSWRDLFKMPLPDNRRLQTTIRMAGTSINYLDNPQALTFEEVINYHKSNQVLIKSQKNERKNLHTAVWNSISHVIRNRIAASGTNITDGVELVAWIYQTYSMQTEEARTNFLNKITSLTITKSRSVENFLVYVESILNDGNMIGQDQREMLRDATFRELTKVNSTTFTATLLSYKMTFEKANQKMTIEELIARARKEYISERALGNWTDTRTRTTRPRRPETEQVVALKAEINRLQQNRLPTQTQVSRKPPDWGEGSDFATKDDFWNWKWSRPSDITKSETKNNKTWWFCTRCNWRTGHTVERCRKPEGTQPRQRPPPPYQAQHKFEYSTGTST